MKIGIKVLALLTAFGVSSFCRAQEINWQNFKDGKRHVAGVMAGWDYGMVMGVKYGQKLKTKLPVLVNIDYSSPFGKTVFDDFKARLGGQVQLVKLNNFIVTGKAYAVFRRYENDMVRLFSFGSEFSAVAGYYRNKWFVAGEAGFDKAISTHIKNSDNMKSNYLSIVDGWYVPTGGNFNYGIVSGYTFKSNDVYIKAGKILTENFKTAPTVPLYLQLGYNRRF
jgi:hypothetical protein